MNRWARRAILAIATTCITAVMIIPPAAAIAAMPPTSAMGLWDVGGLSDTSGIGIDHYRSLDLNEGGMLDTSQKITAFFIRTGWGLYWMPTALTIWFLDFVLAMSWLDLLLTPFEALASTLDAIMGTLGLRGVMLLVLGLSVAVMLLRGRPGAGMANLGMGVLIAALGAGLLANPYAAVGASDGAIRTARDAGLELVDAINSSGASITNPAAAGDGNPLTQSLATTLLRTPYQLINYGAVIDGGSCEQVFNEVVGGDSARAEIGSCDSALGDVADNPTAEMLAASGFLHFVLIAFVIFGLVLGILALISVLGAAWAGVRLAFDLVVGIATHFGRSTLGRSAAMLAFSLTMIAGVYAFIAAWMLIIADVMKVDSDNPILAGVPIMVRIYLMAVMLLIGCGVAVIMRRGLKRRFEAAGHRLAAIGGGTAPQPAPREPISRSVGRTIRTVHDLSSLAGRLPARRPGASAAVDDSPPAHRPSPVASTSTAPQLPAARTPKLAAAPAAPPPPTSPSGPPDPGAGPAGTPRRALDSPARGDRRAMVRKVLTSAAAAGAVAATGGAAAPGATAAVSGTSTAGAAAAGGAAKTAAGATGKAAATHAGKAAAREAGKVAAKKAGSSASSSTTEPTRPHGQPAAAAPPPDSSRGADRAARNATAKTPGARTVRNEALRTRLAKVEPVTYSSHGAGVRDESTGISYTRAAPLRPGGVEVLIPQRSEPHPVESPPADSDAGQRLADRLRRRRNDADGAR